VTAAILTASAAVTATATHQGWCAEHWSDDAVCWAQDIVLQVRPSAGDDDGRITAVMTHGSRTGAPAVNVTLFSDTVRDGEGSVEFDPDEAEVAAHALLAMVMRSRGFTSAADWHETTAKRCAAELLAGRNGGAK
jgi:hypothetical protein